MSEIRFYLDENMNPAIAEQLVQKGIDAVTVRDLDELGESDLNHLQRATELGRVVCTHDTDFLRLANEFLDHAGIAYLHHYQASIGYVVRSLVDLHANTTAEDMQGMVKYL